MQKLEVNFKVQVSFQDSEMNINFRENVNLILCNYTKNEIKNSAF